MICMNWTFVYLLFSLVCIPIVFSGLYTCCFLVYIFVWSLGCSLAGLKSAWNLEILHVSVSSNFFVVKQISSSPDDRCLHLVDICNGKYIVNSTFTRVAPFYDSYKCSTQKISNCICIYLVLILVLIQCPYFIVYHSEEACTCINIAHHFQYISHI